MRLGYVPHSLEFLGPARSLYLIAGTRWVDAGIEARHVNWALDIAGSRRAERTLTPWLIGTEIATHASPESSDTISNENCERGSGFQAALSR